MWTKQSDNNFKDQVLFENELNENSTDYANLGYPLYPNAAGIAWIDLIKKKWTSDEIIELGANKQQEIFNRNIFNGNFEFELISPGI